MPALDSIRSAISLNVTCDCGGSACSDKGQHGGYDAKVINILDTPTLMAWTIAAIVLVSF